MNAEGESERQTATKVLLCGGIAGVVTWASIFPLDVIKTRLQTQPSQITPLLEEAPLLTREHSHGNSTRGGVGAYGIAKIAYREEGFAVFFRGLGVCSIRAFIVNAVQVCRECSFPGGTLADMNSGRSTNGLCVLSDRHDYHPLLQIERGNTAWHRPNVFHKYNVPVSYMESRKRV